VRKTLKRCAWISLAATAIVVTFVLPVFVDRHPPCAAKVICEFDESPLSQARVVATFAGLVVTAGFAVASGIARELDEA
jgi:hypothetical protein